MLIGCKCQSILKYFPLFHYFIAPCLGSVVECWNLPGFRSTVFRIVFYPLSLPHSLVFSFSPFSQLFVWFWEASCEQKKNETIQFSFGRQYNQVAKCVRIGWRVLSTCFFSVALFFPTVAL